MLRLGAVQGEICRPVFFFTLRMSFMTFLLRFPSLLAGGIAYNARDGSVSLIPLLSLIR